MGLTSEQISLQKMESLVYVSATNVVMFGSKHENKLIRTL